VNSRRTLLLENISNIIISFFKPIDFEIFKQKSIRREIVIEILKSYLMAIKKNLPFYPSQKTVEENLIIDTFMCRLRLSV